MNNVLQYQGQIYTPSGEERHVPLQKTASFNRRRLSQDCQAQKIITGLKHHKKHNQKFQPFVPISKVEEEHHSTHDSNSTHHCSDEAHSDHSPARAETYCEATRKKIKKAFANDQERQEFNSNVEKKKKTEMCKNMVHFGECKFGDNCSFAHSVSELQKKKHVPSNYMTKLCQQFHDPQIGYCNYGERCQFLHSIYDRRKPMGYMKGLYEGARLTMLRSEQISETQGADFVWVNLVKGEGCGAPKTRFSCFEKIYNKEEYQKQLNEQKLKQQEEQRQEAHKKASRHIHNQAARNTFRPHYQQFQPVY